MSRALSAAGVPCGHERVFNADTFGDWPDDLRADSSWMAATGIDAVDVPVITVVRHPLLVVRSLMEIGFFTWDLGNPTHKTLRQAFPEVYRWKSPQNLALEMWIRLTRAALSRAEAVFRIDRMTTETFGRVLSWVGTDSSQAESVLGSIPRCNRHEESRAKTGREYRASWSAHDLSLASRARELASILGYDKEEE
jgi:hypothetical protein